MDLFRSLSDAELEAAIKDLAMQIASGATQISSPEAGAASYMGRADGMRLLRSLERSRARRLGLPGDGADRWRSVRVVSPNEYWQR